MSPEWNTGEEDTRATALRVTEERRRGGAHRRGGEDEHRRRRG